MVIKALIRLPIDELNELEPRALPLVLAAIKANYEHFDYRDKEIAHHILNASEQGKALHFELAARSIQDIKEQGEANASVLYPFCRVVMICFRASLGMTSSALGACLGRATSMFCRISSVS